MQQIKPYGILSQKESVLPDYMAKTPKSDHVFWGIINLLDSMIVNASRLVRERPTERYVYDEFLQTIGEAFGVSSCGMNISVLEEILSKNLSCKFMLKTFRLYKVPNNNKATLPFVLSKVIVGDYIFCVGAIKLYLYQTLNDEEKIQVVRLLSVVSDLHIQVEYVQKDVLRIGNSLGLGKVKLTDPNWFEKLKKNGVW